MISLQQIHRFFYRLSLTAILLIIVIFSFGAEKSWATMPINQLMHSPQPQIAIMNRIDAMSKDVEGKAQEAIGNLTGDPKNQMMGKAKQVQSQAMNAAEDVKDSTELKGRAKAVAKNLEGKAQEMKGNITDNTQDKMMGKAKQAESQARNLAEDIKDVFR
ncbi:CsbD family protein [Synechocystis salina]|uniref:CsbD family protein n=1 Tax=Synechocystis salina LEGE 00031 TaxID=1828736 RepID=A0ABR9VVL0_9SYNC|nr:CsbD family protein [Synechocystis salina]MBE9241955.1 CsbD family protein [Synechocystis salina LEGE 00041]MBE9255384.1 CsbD family protein [Synechocystis salina LEGE 00031]